MELKKRLGVFDLTCLGLNCIIGTGLFFAPGEIAERLGPYAPWLVLLGGVLCLGIGLCFAEMAGMVPGNGGAYLYARAVFGPFVGYLVGWVMWLSCLLGGATVATGFAETVDKIYLPEVPQPGLRLAVATSIVVLLAMVNYRGVRSGAVSNDLLAVLKLIPLAILLVWSLGGLNLARGFTLETPPHVAWVLGFLSILFCFSGFEEIPVPGGEVHEPQRTIPRAYIVTLLFTTGLYFWLQLIVGAAGAVGSKTPLLDAAALGGLASLIGIGALLSQASVNASIAFTTPRSLWALAATGWAPRWLARLHPTFASPARAILVSTLLMVALIKLLTFSALLDLSVLASLLQYLATILGVLVWRIQRPAEPRPFRVPAVWLVGGLSLAVVVFLLSQTPAVYIKQWGLGLALGLVLALFSPRRDFGPPKS